MREKRMRFKSGSYCRSFSFKSKKKERKKYIFLLTAIYTFSFDFFKKSPLLSSRSKRKEKKKRKIQRRETFTIHVATCFSYITDHRAALLPYDNGPGNKPVDNLNILFLSWKRSNPSLHPLGRKSIRKDGSFFLSFLPFSKQLTGQLATEKRGEGREGEGEEGR